MSKVLTANARRVESSLFAKADPACPYGHRSSKSSQRSQEYPMPSHECVAQCSDLTLASWASD